MIKIFYITALLAFLCICNVESNFIKCIEVETPAEKYARLAKSISDINSQIATQKGYLQGNETALTEAIKNFTIISSFLIASSCTPPKVADDFRNASQIIQNYTASTKSGSTAARKKRSIGLNLAGQILTGYELALKAAKIGVKNTETARPINLIIPEDKTQITETNIIVGYQSMKLLTDLLTNLANTQSTIFSESMRQLVNYAELLDIMNELAFELCGLFTSYNANTDPNAPVGKAFFAGTYIDGSEIYVGRAIGTGSSDTLSPGRCTISKNLGGPGVYVESDGYEERVADSVAFLNTHKLLTWVSADLENAPKTPNTIKVKAVDGKVEFLIGRVNLTLENSTTYTQIAKYHVGNPNGIYLWFFDINQNTSKITTPFDVLTCDASKVIKIASAVAAKAATQNVSDVSDKTAEDIQTIMDVASNEINDYIATFGDSFLTPLIPYFPFLTNN